MATMNELRRLYENAMREGAPLPAVQFTERVEEVESYFDNGMRARVVRIERDSEYPPSEGGWMYNVYFSFSEFDTYNKQFECSNYYDGNGVARLTAAEANCKPENGIESLYFMQFGDEDEPYFHLVNEEDVTIRLPDSEARKVVEQAIFFHKGTLEMRVREASTGAFGGVAASEEDRDQAQKELDALLRAMKAMGIEE